MPFIEVLGLYSPGGLVDRISGSLFDILHSNLVLPIIQLHFWLFNCSTLKRV